MKYTSFRMAGAAAGVGALLALAGCGGSDNSTISFTPYQTNYGVVVGDFADNGLPDVIAARTLNQPTMPYESGTLQVYLHNTPASAGYAAPASINAGNEPLYMVAADINGDGLPDVVTANFDDAQIAVYLNQPSAPGTFAAPLLLPAPGVSQIAVADINGDGLPDIVAADYAVHVFLQDSALPGTFLAPLGLSSGGANWVAIGDLNHDGLPDIVVTDAASVKLFVHAPPGSGATFQAPVSVFTQTPNMSFLGANFVAIADVDADGYQDLVITDPNTYGPSPPTVNVLRQDSATPGTFLAAVTYPLTNGQVAQSIQVADLNGDGFPDVIVGDRGGVSVLLQNASGDGTFATSAYYAVPYGAFQTAIGDVNGDGHPDIVVTNGPTSPLTMGTYTIQPGVLLQVAGMPGTFAAVQNLP